jgi:hypothetical protein
MKFQSYFNFINESERVKLDADLREYTLTHTNGSNFKLKSKNFIKDFSVEPFKNEDKDKLKSALHSLEHSLETLDINDLYSAVEKAELIPYKYGNVYNTKFSLKIIPELLTLDNDDKDMLNNSEKQFILNRYSTLDREKRDLISLELRERAEVLCSVIEALFYFIRISDTNNFYNGKSATEITEELDKEVEKSSIDNAFSVEGPYADNETKKTIDDNSEYAFWLCEKDLKKFCIKASINPKIIRSEDKLGTPGLKFSIVESEDGSQYKFFISNNLSNIIKIYFNKILK